MQIVTHTHTHTLVSLTGAISSTALSTDVPFNAFRRQCAQWLGAQALRERAASVQLQALKHNSCVTLGKIQTFSEFLFPHL